MSHCFWRVLDFKNCADVKTSIIYIGFNISMCYNIYGINLLIFKTVLYILFVLNFISCYFLFELVNS